MVDAKRTIRDMNNDLVFVAIFIHWVYIIELCIMFAVAV